MDITLKGYGDGGQIEKSGLLDGVEGYRIENESHEREGDRAVYTTDLFIPGDEADSTPPDAYDRFRANFSHRSGQHVTVRLPVNEEYTVMEDGSLITVQIVFGEDGSPEPRLIPVPQGGESVAIPELDLLPKGSYKILGETFDPEEGTVDVSFDLTPEQPSDFKTLIFSNDSSKATKAAGLLKKIESGASSYFWDGDGNVQTHEDQYALTPEWSKKMADRLDWPQSETRLPDFVNNKVYLLALNDNGEVDVEPATDAETGKPNLVQRLGRGQIHLPRTAEERKLVERYIAEQATDKSPYTSANFRKVRFRYEIKPAQGGEALPVEDDLYFLVIPEIQEISCANNAEAFHEINGYLELEDSFTKEQTMPLNDFLASYHISDSAFGGCTIDSSLKGGKLTRNFKVKMDAAQIPAMIAALEKAMALTEPPAAGEEDRYVKAAYDLLQTLNDDERGKLIKTLNDYKAAKDKGYTPPDPNHIGITAAIGFAGTLAAGTILVLLWQATRWGAKIMATAEEKKTEEEKKRMAEKTLDQYMAEFGEDWVEKAARGEFTSAEGRDIEVRDVFVTWLQKTKNFAATLGPAGIGKSAVAEEVARHIYLRRLIMKKETELRALPRDNSNKLAPNARLTPQQVESLGMEWSLCPETLARIRYFELSIPKMVAGTQYRGQMEARAVRFIELSGENPEAYVHIEELYDSAKSTDVNESSSAQVLKTFKYPLSRGGIRGSSSLTYEDYLKLQVQDEQMTRRFQAVLVRLLPEKVVDVIINKTVGRQLAGAKGRPRSTGDPSGSLFRRAWRRSAEAAHRVRRDPKGTGLLVADGLSYPLRHPLLTAKALRGGAKKSLVSDIIPPQTPPTRLSRVVLSPSPLMFTEAELTEIQGRDSFTPGQWSRLEQRVLFDADELREIKDRGRFSESELSRVRAPDFFSKEQLAVIRERAKVFPGEEPDRSKTLAEFMMSCVQYDLEMGTLDPENYTENAADGTIRLKLTTKLIDNLLKGRVQDPRFLEQEYQISELITKLGRKGFAAEELGIDSKAYKPLPNEVPYLTIARLQRIRGALQNLLSVFESVGRSSQATTASLKEAIQNVKDTYARKGIDTPTPPPTTPPPAPQGPSGGGGAAGAPQSGPKVTRGRGAAGRGRGSGGSGGSGSSASAIEAPKGTPKLVRTGLEEFYLRRINDAVVCDALVHVDPDLARFYSENISTALNPVETFSDIAWRVSQQTIDAALSRISADGLFIGEAVERLVFELIAKEAEARGMAVETDAVRRAGMAARFEAELRKRKGIEKKEARPEEKPRDPELERRLEAIRAGGRR